MLGKWKPTYLHVLETEIDQIKVDCIINDRYMRLLNEIFPRSKFVFMVRDGRDAAYSFMQKDKLDKKRMVFSTFVIYLWMWNKSVYDTSYVCEELGSQVCLLVRYEKLVIFN